MTHDDEQDLRRLISQEESRVLQSFPMERRLGVMEVTRAMDHHWVGRYLGLVNEREQSDAGTLIEFGLSKALGLFLDESSRYPRFPLMRSTPELQRWADSVLQHCGRLGQCEQILEICKVGLGELERVDLSTYVFRVLPGPVGLESMEREEFLWLQGFIAEQQMEDLHQLQSESAQTRPMLANLVKPWKDHFIQYDAHPELDRFYQRRGILAAQRLHGQDSFPGDVLFGGEPFDLYRAAVGILIGWSLRHIDFCVELLIQHPDLEARNVLTIPQDLEVKAGYLASALEVDVGSAEQAMRVVTLGLNNMGVHCSVPGEYISPTFIEGGQGRLICPVWGSLSHPFQFMLDELRRSYRKDWDRAVGLRESYFRMELYTLLPGERFKKVDRNVVMRAGSSIVTDVDAAVLDREAGTLALFQLKWQDAFRTSMRSRESTKRNLQFEGNQWVERMHAWLADRSLEVAARTLGFERDDSASVKRLLLFVVGRNAVHFSGPGSLDERAAWGTWYQVVRLVAEDLDTSDPLGGLFRAMVDNSPLKRDRPRVGEGEIRIGKTVIHLEKI